MIAELDLTAFKNWNARLAYQWNPDRSRTEYSDVRVQYRPQSDRVVNASYRLLAWGSQPIGALLGGLIGELLGLEAVFLLAGAATLALVAARRIVTDTTIAEAEADGDREAAALAAASGEPAPSRT